MTFGSFVDICAQSPIPICYLLGRPSSLTSTHNPIILPQCAARSIELANTIIFEAATDFAHLAALLMATIMIFHVRSKFTAVGRKEILTFFYVYVLLTIISLVLDAGVMPASTGGPFLWFTAVQNGLSSALCTSLLINGFVGFQMYEDGTTMSVWALRVATSVMFGITFLVSILTFKNLGGLGPENTTVLFVVLYLIDAIFLAVYLVMQVILVVNTLQDRWPLWDLAAAVFFFVVGQVILYTFGARLCIAVNHYLDGLFFATVCNLLAVMMVYKYWDSITKEDLEFSVGTKQTNWTADLKDPYFDDNTTDYQSTNLNHRTSYYDVAPTGRDSMYDASSLDYRPASHGGYAGSQHRGSTHGAPVSQSGYGQLSEARRSYGDLRTPGNRKSNQAVVAVYEDQASEANSYDTQERERIVRDVRRQSYGKASNSRSRTREYRERELAY